MSVGPVVPLLGESTVLLVCSRIKVLPADLTDGVAVAGGVLFGVLIILPPSAIRAVRLSATNLLGRLAW